MKTTPAPASSAPPWRGLALVLLAVNVLLLTLVLVMIAQRDRSRVGTAASPAKQENAVPPVSLPATSNPTGPYAALGSYMAENNRIPDLGWTEEQFADFQAGFRSSYEGRGVPMDDDAKRLRDEISARVQKMIESEQPDPVEDYFRMLREKEAVSRTSSGLHYRIVEPGLGEMPTAADTVVLSFAARLPDGGELPKFSRARVRMAVRDLLPGLAEGIQLLKVRGKALMYLPPNLSFSPENWPEEIPAGAPIALFVELHEVIPAER